MIDARKRSPSLEELKQKAFKQNTDPELKKRHGKSIALYYPLHVTYFFSIRIVRYLYDKPITPNQITWFSIFLALIGAVLFSLGSRSSCLLGALFFELYYIFDCVDGQYARAKGLSSFGGRYLDVFCNYLVLPAVIFGIGLGAYKENLSGLNIIFVFLASYTVLIIPTIAVLYIHVKNTDNTKKFQEDNIEPEVARSKTVFKAAYSLCYRTCTMPIAMNMITIAGILYFFTSISLFKIIIVYFAFVGTSVWLLKIMHIAKD